MQPSRLAKSQALAIAIATAIENHLAPESRAGLIAAGCYDAVREHHRSVNLLVENGHFGSAFALLRTMLEGCVVGLWATYVASEPEFDRFESGRLTLEPSKVFPRLKPKDDGNYVATLEQIYIRTKSLLSGYVHGGHVQVASRIGETFIGPNYTEQEIDDLLTFSNGMVIIAAMEIATLTGEVALKEEIKRLVSLHVHPQA